MQLPKAADGEMRAVSGDELPLDRLEPYLRAALGLPASSSVHVERFPHGHSNLTYLVRCGDRKWVLRRPPQGRVPKGAHDMRREHRFMAALHEAYSLAPPSLHYCEDDSVIGAAFHLVEYRRGVALRQPLPGETVLDPERMRALCGAFVESFVRLHEVDYAAAGLADAGRPIGYAARQVAGWRKRYRDAETGRIPEMGAVADELGRRVPSTNTAAIVHNDFKFDNLLLDPADLTRIVAVLDWEMSTIGDPWMDLGTTLALWFEPADAEPLRAVRPGPTLLAGAYGRAELVDRYGERSGRAVRDPDFYYAYGLFKLAVVFQQSYARYVRGQTTDPRFKSYHGKVVALARQAVATLDSGRV